MKRLSVTLFSLLIAASVVAVSAAKDEKAAKDAKPAAGSSAAAPAPPEPGAVQIIVGKGGGRRLPGSATASAPLGNAPLSDVVKAANDTKRKKSTGKTKVITASQVGKAKTGAVPPAKPGEPPAVRTGYDTVRDSKGRNEDWWRSTMKSADNRIAGLEQEIASLDSEIAGLRTAFTSMDDPAYRDGVIKPKWDAAIARQDQARIELDQARISKEALLEDARRSGALPGWLR